MGGGAAAGLERRCGAGQGALGSGSSALAPARPGTRSWTGPGRARSPCPPRRSPRMVGTELSAVRQGRVAGQRACAADRALPGRPAVTRGAGPSCQQET